MKIDIKPYIKYDEKDIRLDRISIQPYIFFKFIKTQRFLYFI